MAAIEAGEYAIVRFADVLEADPSGLTRDVVLRVHFIPPAQRPVR